MVIIGAGFGGLQAAKSRTDNHHLFQPMLYQAATTSLSPADIALPIRGKPLPGLAPLAWQEAKYVASVIEDKLQGKEHIALLDFIER